MYVLVCCINNQYLFYSVDLINFNYIISYQCHTLNDRQEDTCYISIRFVYITQVLNIDVVGLHAKHCLVCFIFLK